VPGKSSNMPGTIIAAIRALKAGHNTGGEHAGPINFDFLTSIDMSTPGKTHNVGGKAF